MQKKYLRAVESIVKTIWTTEKNNKFLSLYKNGFLIK